MILVIGLGPMGGNIGLRLAELNRDVAGLDLMSELASSWSAESGRPAWSSYSSVPWQEVDTVLIVVKLAEHVEQCAAEILKYTSAPLDVFVATTLSASDARRLLPNLPSQWRVFESPVSGGPRGSRTGTLTIFLSGPPRTTSDKQLLADTAKNVFEFGEYGQAALIKLLNNTLGAYNAVATAKIIDLCDQLGGDTGRLREVIAVSSGQSWMSDNFSEFHYAMLFKDVGLLVDDAPDLPAVSLLPLDQLAPVIEHARAISGPSAD